MKKILIAITIQLLFITNLVIADTYEKQDDYTMKITRTAQESINLYSLKTRRNFIIGEIGRRQQEIMNLEAQVLELNKLINEANKLGIKE